jgi:hypothetical protein
MTDIHRLVGKFVGLTGQKRRNAVVIGQGEGLSSGVSMPDRPLTTIHVHREENLIGFGLTQNVKNAGQRDRRLR